MILVRAGLLILFAACLLAGPTATLTGRITDPSGGVIPGVKVEATNVETNVTFPGETNAEGLYNIPNLPPGTYRIIVQKSSFQTIVKPDVELHVQDVIALNFSMAEHGISGTSAVSACNHRAAWTTGLWRSCARAPPASGHALSAG